MLTIGKSREPSKVVLKEAVGAPGKKGFEPEAFVRLAPITSPMRRRAARATRRLLGDLEITDLDVDRLIDASEAGAKELIRLGIVEWGGIGDLDGNEIAPTPDRDTRFATANDADRPTGTVDDLLADEDIFDKLAEEYVRPDALRRAEKNALSASPSGTGGAATQARDTASSPANRTVRRAAAKTARTASSGSGRKRPKPSGTR